MMRNKKNTIAKLLAEEDIFVIHKQMETAYFDVKNRELGLPIWKENAINDVEEELMVCHEIGHALETPLSMLEDATIRKIEHSVVNVLEDARIEKKVKNKYLGTVRIFNAGYDSLIKKDFFGTSGKDLATFNLIDRINLFFKGNTDVVFSDEEKVWVDRTAKTETPDNVLDLAEELIAWMSDNPESMGSPDESDEGESGEAGNGKSDKSDPTGEGESGKTGKEEGEKNDISKDVSKSDDDNSNANSSGDDSDDADDASTDDKKELKVPDTKDVVEGGKGGEGAASTPNITAETDSKFGKSITDARDMNAQNVDYVRINDIDLDDVVVPYKKVIEDNEKYYKKDMYFISTSNEINELKKSSKKTVAYMVKEFEMKKSADAYARAAVSKTGSLDMGKLHTYKYNEDLFKKVTTLPGATSHGLVMCLDWSGSMAENLNGTLSQLFNLIWFCRRTNIPFEVFAFSDVYSKFNEVELEREAGVFQLRNFAMLNFFSSKMTIEEEMKMMHYVWMIANQWGNRDWNVDGYPQRATRSYQLGGTPLNEAILAMMNIVPKFKKESGVQKVHSIFLTDGAGSSLSTKSEWMLDTKTGSPSFGKHFLGYSTLSEKMVITDPVTNKTVEIDNDKWNRRLNVTPALLELLKNRVSEMNVVGFFVAGSGRGGRVKADTLRYAVEGWNSKYNGDVEIVKALSDLKKNNVFVSKSKGYDEYYILPGAAQLNVEEFEMSDELVGASKAKLKTAFAKSSAGRISSRPLLNKFIAMVA